MNTGGAPLTAYQAYAADVDGNGRVELSDAISVLKRIVGLETATANWMFFNGTPTVTDKLNPGVPASVSAAVSATSVSLSSDNARYKGSFDYNDLPAFLLAAGNPANWQADDTTAFALVNNSLFPV